VEDTQQPVRAELRRRTRRLGVLYLLSAPVFGILIGVSTRPIWGLVLGALFVGLGLYVRFAFVPFAAWLRRRELAR
jgi:hypothetical protein